MNETEMWTQLAGYIISGLVALYVASKQHSKTTALLEYQLDELKKDFKELKDKVEKHNNFIERLGIVETKLDLLAKGKSNG